MSHLLQSSFPALKLKLDEKDDSWQLRIECLKLQKLLKLVFQAALE